MTLCMSDDWDTHVDEPIKLRVAAKVTYEYRAVFQNKVILNRNLFKEFTAATEFFSTVVILYLGPSSNRRGVHHVVHLHLLGPVLT